MEVGCIGTGGGCRFIIGNKAVVPVIWHRVTKLNIISTLAKLGLHSSVSIYSVIIGLWFGVNLLVHQLFDLSGSTCWDSLNGIRLLNCRCWGTIILLWCSYARGGLSLRVEQICSSLFPSSIRRRGISIPIKEIVVLTSVQVMDHSCKVWIQVTHFMLEQL